MNLTGPLPKNILSPGTVTNQSQGKSKHSQYFDTSSEIVGTQYHQQYINNMNASQQFPLMQGGTPSNAAQKQHQYQVSVNGAQGGAGQHQITTSGGNTVININIDSNSWNPHPRERSYPSQIATRENDENERQNENTRNDKNFIPSTNSITKK